MLYIDYNISEGKLLLVEYVYNLQGVWKVLNQWEF
jgi:hypothetical protein